jgi:hypothetical protein
LAAPVCAAEVEAAEAAEPLELPLDLAEVIEPELDLALLDAPEVLAAEVVAALAARLPLDPEAAEAVAVA